MGLEQVADFQLQIQELISRATLFIQALGIVVAFWVIYLIFAIVSALKKGKQSKILQNKIDSIEKKLDRLLKIKK